MPFDTPLNTNDQSFDRVLKAGLPLVTMFLSGTTDSALEDALKSLAKANAGNLLVAKVRIDENPQLVQRYTIRAPTVITFKNGNEYSRAENPSAADVRAHAEYVLGHGAKPQAAPPPRVERPQQAPQTDGKPVQ